MSGAVQGKGWSLAVDSCAEGRQGHGRGRRVRPGVRARRRCTPRWTRRGATTSSATTAPPTWCTTCFGSGSAPMCGSRAPWCSRSGCGSTSPTMGRSTPPRSQAIEAEVNDLVLANDVVTTREMPYADALALGAMAFFSEKYGDVVRVVQMGPSIELCGGTHVRTTGQIGTFRFSGQIGRGRRRPADRGGHRRAARSAPCASWSSGWPGGRGTQGAAGAPACAGWSSCWRSGSGCEARLAEALRSRAAGARSRATSDVRRRGAHRRGDRLRRSGRAGPDRRPVPRGQAKRGSGAVQLARVGARFTSRSPMTWSAPGARRATW